MSENHINIEEKLKEIFDGIEEKGSSKYIKEAGTPTKFLGDEMRKITHREFEEKYLGGDTRKKAETPVCKCGQPMSENPHVHAGDPRAISKVGARFECIPCRVNKARESWQRICDLESENFAQSDLIAKLEKDIETRIEISAKRLIELENIRAVIKKHIPNAYGQGCVKPATSEILAVILSQAAETEKGRNAFRDALLHVGFKHTDLVAMVESYQEAE